jgi:hypothetical protein
MRRSSCQEISAIAGTVIRLPFTVINYCLLNPVKSVVLLLAAQGLFAEARFMRPPSNPAQGYLNRHNFAQNVADFLDESMNRQQAMRDMSKHDFRIPTNTERWQNSMTDHHIFCRSRGNCDSPPERPITDGPMYRRADGLELYK